MVKMAGVSAWCTVLLASFGGTLTGYSIRLVIISLAIYFPIVLMALCVYITWELYPESLEPGHGSFHISSDCS